MKENNDHPAPYFLEICSHSAFSPICKSLDITNPSWPKSLGGFYVCNGPFIIDIVNNKEIVLKKNPFFWEKNHIKLEKVVISNMTEQDALQTFQSKKLDALLYPFCENKISKSQHFFNIQKKKCTSEVRYLTFNCSKPPFSNRKMRQAFSPALQRKILTCSFSNSSESSPHYSPYPLDFTQLNLSTCKEENYTLAKKLFFESLEEDGLEPNIFDQEKIYANSLSRGIEVIIAKQLNEVFGLKLCPITIDNISFFSLIREKRINIYMYVWLNRIQDPSYFLNAFSSKGNIINISCWNCKKINYLSKLIQKTNCPIARNKLHFKAEEILHKEKPVIPLFSNSACSIIQPNVNNIYVGNSQEFDIRYCFKK